MSEYSEIMSRALEVAQDRLSNTEMEKVYIAKEDLFNRGIYILGQFISRRFARNQKHSNNNQG